MKKTLIALAVAASAVVSGSAMAWDPNGTGGSLELGGTLSPVEKQTPWEVQVGAAVTNLNGQIQKGVTTAEITTAANIPVLGIRNTTVFNGQPNIKPIINFGGALNVDNFSGNMSTLTLNVNGQGGKIGVLTAPVYAAAILKAKYGEAVDMNYLAANGGGAFSGGLPVSTSGVTMSGAYETLAQIFSDIWQNEIPDAAKSWNITENERFADGSVQYSASYAAGILKDARINIKLDTPAAADDIAWTASLPVTVSYQ
ncbi:fimbrial protein [Salmonella enterica subsp. enterica serovar Telelkebir]|nr:fimbrial protein [Salmonella enterica subsp. enterica serovar Telelkebir]